MGPMKKDVQPIGFNVPPPSAPYDDAGQTNPPQQQQTNVQYPPQQQQHVIQRKNVYCDEEPKSFHLKSFREKHFRNHFNADSGS